MSIFECMIEMTEKDFLVKIENLLDILLLDRTMERNICWGTAQYATKGDGYRAEDPIEKILINGKNGDMIRPRITRSREEQTRRTKNHAEVFTPAWVCNAQNNLVDDCWFGREKVFNVVSDHSWRAIEGTVSFPASKTWQDYVDSNRLEITCGEAPYLVSRYDMVTGEKIPVQERIGLLDRKLRIVSENTQDEQTWLVWTRRAFESIYGFEYQGDNLLIARINLLLTFVEYLRLRLDREPSDGELYDIAEIISWNIWQMDGLTQMVPYARRPVVKKQPTLFDFGLEGAQEEMEPVPCLIRDWRRGVNLEFRSLMKK